MIFYDLESEFRFCVVNLSGRQWRESLCLWCVDQFAKNSPRQLVSVSAGQTLENPVIPRGNGTMIAVQDWV
jgi:hypothetical protein